MSNKNARRNGNKRKQAEIQIHSDAFEAFYLEWNPVTEDEDVLTPA